MPENLRVQRNAYDVAVELTKLYCEEIQITNSDEIAEAYSKYYAIAAYLSRVDPGLLMNAIPSDILNSLKVK